MTSCCGGKEEELEKTARRHRKVLWTVLAINFVMFFVESVLGIISNSSALIADSLDMLGDTVTYASSIAVVGMGVGKKARVAKLKAWIMLGFGLLISIRCLYRVIYPELPAFDIMVVVGTGALLANLFCLYLLTAHRDDDINMKSVWICSRNDIVANVSVILAAIVVLFTSSPIPDLVVGLGLAFLFTKSAFGILKEAAA